MNEILMVYILCFVSAALLTLGVYRYYARDRPTQKKINRRMSLIENASDRAEVLEALRRERGLGGLSTQRFQAIHEYVVQSGLNLQSTTFKMAVVGLSFGITLIIIIAMGFNIQNIILSVCMAAGVLALWVRRARARRIAHFGEQLPEVLDIIVRSLKAGHPLPVALTLVGREMADPAGTEFGIASDEVTFGLDLPTAMLNLSKRVGDPDLLYVVTSVSVQAQSGGNLAEVLGRLGKLIRERFRMRRKAIALAAEGRMSAIILTVFPIALFLVIKVLSPKYYGEVWHDPAFHSAMGVGVALLVIGNFIMRRMANFKF